MAVRAEHRSNLQPFNDNGDVFKRGKNSRVGRKKTTNYLFLCVIFVFLLQHIWPILLQKHTRDDMPFWGLFGSLSRTSHVSNILKQPPDKQFAEQFCFSLPLYIIDTGNWVPGKRDNVRKLDTHGKNF